MEEYLQHMKTLRTQMNEVEDQAAKISVEEQMLLTTAQNLEKDLLFLKDSTERVKEECESIMKSKGLICSEILEKQRKISSLESESYNLSQTLDLMQQENVALSAKLEEKSSYYTEVAEDIASKIKDQQDWINARKFSSITKSNALVDGKSCHKTCETEEFQPNEINSTMLKVDAAKAKLDQMAQMKNTLISENRKIKQSMEVLKAKIGNFEPELRELDNKMLEEELLALQGDKDGETEYLQSLQLQIKTLKEISQKVKCSCGKEYRVEVGHGLGA